MRGTSSRRAGQRGYARMAGAADDRDSSDGTGVSAAAAAAGLARIMARAPTYEDPNPAIAAVLAEALPLIGRSFAILLDREGQVLATAAALKDSPGAFDYDGALAAASAALRGKRSTNAAISALPIRVNGKIVAALAASDGAAPKAPGYAEILDLLVECLGGLIARPARPQTAAPAKPRGGVADRLIDGIAGHDDGVALFGPDGGLVAANPAFAGAYDADVRALRGLTLEEILRRNHDGVGPLLLGRDLRGQSDGALGADLALAADGRWLRLSRRRAANGDEMVLQSPADDAIATAMTARRARAAGAEARAAEMDIWAGLPVGVLLLSRSGRIEEMNAEAERLLKAKGRDLIGRRLGRASADAGRDWTALGPTKSAAGGLMGKTRKLANGRSVLTLVAAFDLPRPAAAEAPATAPVTDGRSMKVERALAAFDALGELGHEMRTPLNAIIGFSDIMLARSFGPVNERQAQYLGDIGKAGRHMLEMVDHMFDHAQLTAGRFPYNPDWVDLTELAEDAARFLEPASTAGDVSLSTTVSGNLEGYIDRRGILQALINLMTNAVKFTPSGGEAELVVEADDDGLYFTVSDTGEGIPDADLDRVSEPFTQARRLGGSPLKGAGLGLSIVRSLAELHDGTIAISSKLGQGTSVTIQLAGSRARVRTKPEERL